MITSRFFLHLSLLLLTFPFFACSSNAQSQNKLRTANNYVPPLNDGYRMGTNMGYFNMTDEQLADLSAGNDSLGIKGLGIKALRASLPESFLEQWGYNIRTDAFQHYERLKLKNNVIFLGYPSEKHRDTTQYCKGKRTEVFANLYTPIWDDGKDGTPVNDTNYFALYVYKTVKKYDSTIRFWEIWNEPDYDLLGNGWKTVGIPGNWWQNNPGACECALLSPIFYYVRMLRISYEVIKSIDENAYVAVGGLGYPSYLDAVMRNTDNPIDGTATDDYPLKGGAYFDVLSFHSYPHIDGSLRYWNNAIFDFVNERDSDTAAEGLIRKKNEFDVALNNHGYNGSKYPKKGCIVTELNIPRKAFNKEFIGSAEAQRNFAIKSAILAQQNNIWQTHVYTIADLKPEEDATNEFDLMGLYKNFGKPSAHPPTNYQINEAGIAYKTTSDILFGKTYDAEHTQIMGLTNDIRGAAFRDTTGHYTYVLWARTKTDQSEEAAATYSFPADLGIKIVEISEWNSATTKAKSLIIPSTINLTGTPIFLKTNPLEQDELQFTNSDAFSCAPNPTRGDLLLKFEVSQPSVISLDLWSSNGQLIGSIFSPRTISKGVYQQPYQLPTHLSQGVYFLRFMINGKSSTQKIMLY